MGNIKLLKIVGIVGLITLTIVVMILDSKEKQSASTSDQLKPSENIITLEPTVQSSPTLLPSETMEENYLDQEYQDNLNNEDQDIDPNGDQVNGYDYVHFTFLQITH